MKDISMAHIVIREGRISVSMIALLLYGTKMLSLFERRRISWRNM
jgi:hypothetical protein